MLKKKSKQILILLLTCVISVSSVMGSYKKAYAMDLVVQPVIGITVGQIVNTLLVLCGVGIAYDNRQELEAAAVKVLDDFKEWDKKHSQIAWSKIDKWIEDAQSGYIQLQGEFADTWQAFKQFCVATYYKLGFGLIVEDNRPNITSIPVETDILNEFLGYYTDTSTYPYYLVVDRTDGKGLSTGSTAGGSSIFAVFNTVPMIYYENGNLQYIYIADGGMNHTTVKLIGYVSRTDDPRFKIEIINDVKDWGDSGQSTLFNALYNNGFQKIQSNIPVFDSRESAVLWWTENAMDGVLVPPSDIPIIDLPNTAPDVIYGRDENLDNYDVIGGNSYVDSSGNVVSGGGVAVPGWDSLIGVNNGTVTWEDVVGSDIPVDVPVDGTLNDALDIPVSGSDSVDVPVQKPVTDSLPNASGLSMFLADLKKLFPFCIPFDLIDCIRLFKADAKAPQFEWTLSLKPFVNYEYTFDIDLSVFDGVAVICRTMITILYIVGLAQGTRKLIGG